ncbi:MAG: TldD/PmbA family protein [Actinomycetota bacterium]|nr:TldD/PmbA family protein [Actinomycetota bacterium]
MTPVSGVGPQELVERGLAAARGDGCVIVVEESTEANLRWANNTLTTNGVARSRTVTAVSVAGRSAGVVTRQGVATVAEMEDLVAESETAARAAVPAEDAAPLIGGDATSGDWDAPLDRADIGIFAAFAPDLGASLERAARSDQLLYGFADYELTTTFLATSAGSRHRFDQPTGHVEINAKSGDMGRSAWVGRSTATFRDLDMESVHDDLERRLEWARRTVHLDAGRYDTVLPPSAVADLMIPLYWASGARAAADGRTVFSRPGGGTRVGERLTDAALTLRSDPVAPGVGCAPFVTARSSGPSSSVFDNGAPTRPTSWISNGVLGALMQTRYSADLTGLPYTPFIDNLVLDAADPGGDTNHLVAATDRGLLLTCLWYIREVDPTNLLLTGLSRDGVYLVERGEVTAAVNNFRFNESPLDLLRRADAVGTTERTLPREWSDWFTRTAMPPMRVRDFNMSSVSQAS